LKQEQQLVSVQGGAQIDHNLGEVFVLITKLEIVDFFGSSAKACVESSAKVWFEWKDLIDRAFGRRREDTEKKWFTYI